MRRSLLALLAASSALGIAAPAAAHVLRVGTYKGIRGQFNSIQAAVNAARPGDWILIAPGDYKEHSGRAPKGRPDLPSGVLISTPHVYLRGMNRNTVVIDGTKPGTRECSRKRSAQEFGPRGRTKGAHRQGLNGVLVWKAKDVWVQNVTVCNYLHGSGDTGNEIWWNGGDGSRKIGGHGYYGSYLTATSTFFKNEATAAQYGIFSSNWTGGLWDQTYASNFNDSGYYIGACQQICDQTVDHAWAEYNVLGYSGSNSGGQLVVKSSQFDKNQDGFDTNSQNGDNPPPQNGACPHGRISPITHTRSCWVFMDNNVHDNNNPNVPSSGTAARGPVGTGLSLSGARNDTVMHNRFADNDAWGIVVLPYPDSGPPCTGGVLNYPLLGAGGCLFDPYGDAVLHNTFVHNGSFGHPSNGDIATLNVLAGNPTNCFRGNVQRGGGELSTSPSGLEQTYPNCDGSAAPANINFPFFLESLCDTQVSLVSGQPPSCPTGQYPRLRRVVMHPLPAHLKTMPNPCRGVPANPWCALRRQPLPVGLG